SLNKKSFLYIMKKLLFTLLLFPLFSTAQKFDKDTLYTSGGYKIYKGQTLFLANGTSAAGYFKFIKFHFSMNRNDTYILQNSTMLVDKLKSFKNLGNDNYNIRITGTATLKDGKQVPVDMLLEFDKAITSYDGEPAELTVAEEFKIKRTQTVTTASTNQPVPAESRKTGDLQKLMVADEIKKLFDLYKAGALTKEEYEAQKKKLLDRQ
ncbi:MAG: SHOCT domain-containing protein, partial [Ferruginibacter sp.]